MKVLRTLGVWLGWFVPVATTLLGAAWLLLFLALWVGDSLPYQDASNELLVKQAESMKDAWQGVRQGLVVTGVGVVWLAVKIVRRRRPRQGRGLVAASRR